MDSGEPARRKRGRPRNEGAEDKILDAALAEYGEHGWAGFTVDGLARRAGVGKSTVYLRWPDKDAVLTEAVSSRAKRLAPDDTGSLRGDLETLVGRVLRHFHSPAGWATIRVVFDAASSPDRLGDFSETVTAAHSFSVDQIWERAVARGEISVEVPSDLISEIVFGAAIVNALTERLDHRTDTEAELVRHTTLVTDLVIAGITS